MSQISNLAARVYRSMATEAFQSGSRLRPTVFEMKLEGAERQDFPVFGTTDAVQRGSQQPVQPANISTAQPWAIPVPIERFEFVDRQDQRLTKVDAAGPAGDICGKACGRQIDEEIIKALQTVTGSTAYTRDGLTTASLPSGVEWSATEGINMKTGSATALTADNMARR